MKRLRFIALVVITTLLGSFVDYAQEMDTELSALAERLATSIKEHGHKKVTVLDFVDLQGTSSELGKDIAEQLTVDFVATKRDFAVLDRANLKSILDEHKLTIQGLVDPQNAKKFGMFAGVDAIILGTVTPKGKVIQLTAKIITTDTAVIVGAAKATFRADETVLEMLSRGTVSKSGGGGLSDDGSAVTKVFGDLRVEISPLRIGNGTEYVLTMALKNLQRQKSLWVALSTDATGSIRGVLRDSQGHEFQTHWGSVSGIALVANQNGIFANPTEITGGQGITCSMSFDTITGRRLSPGQHNLQLELLVGNDYDGSSGRCTAQNIVTKIDAK